MLMGRKYSKQLLNFDMAETKVVYRFRKVVKEKFGYSVRLEFTKKKSDILKQT